MTNEDSEIKNSYYMYTINDKGVCDSGFFERTSKELLNELRVLKDNNYNHIYVSLKGAIIVNYYKQK